MKLFSIAIMTMLLLALHMTAKAESEPIQTTCPVMLGNPIDPSLFVDHEGQRIYFCCKMCINMFTENPQEYLTNLSTASASIHGSHDHESDHETQETNKIITFIGKFHPVAVHLPIALFLVAALAELLFLFTGGPSLLRSAARFNLLIAVPTAAISVLLGFAAETGTDYPQDYTKIFLLHRSMGVVSLILGTIAALFSELAIRISSGAVIKTYRTALLLTVISVSLTGHLGGLLVYGLNHFSW